MHFAQLDLLLICTWLYIFIHIIRLFMQHWVLYVIVTYTSKTSRMFPNYLMQLIMSKRIVQIQSSSIDQILRDVKKLNVKVVK